MKSRRSRHVERRPLTPSLRSRASSGCSEGSGSWDEEILRCAQDDSQSHYHALITGGDPNTGFIVGERGVVVIDARATPTLAGETVAAIRQVTDKPVRFLVLTH